MRKFERIWVFKSLRFHETHQEHNKNLDSEPVWKDPSLERAPIQNDDFSEVDIYSCHWIPCEPSLSGKTTCLVRPRFLDNRGGLSIQVSLYTWNYFWRNYMSYTTVVSYRYTLMIMTSTSKIVGKKPRSCKPLCKQNSTDVVHGSAECVKSVLDVVAICLCSSLTAHRLCRDCSRPIRHKSHHNWRDPRIHSSPCPSGTVRDVPGMFAWFRG